MSSTETQPDDVLGKQPDASTPNKRTTNRKWKFVRTVLFTYGAICLLMMALETSLVYPRPRIGSPADWELTHPGQTDVTMEAADGTKLHAWLFEHDDPQHVVLYCHGNGEDLSNNADYMAYLRQRLQATVLIFDYRGYGKSEGSPHEAGIISDGLAAQQWLAEHASIKLDQIVLMGRSLGGGVAVALAEQHGARALVLQNTFADMSEVAAEKFPWLPVRWIMRNRYPSAERIKSYDGPVIQIHGTHDQIAPYPHGQKLFDAAPGAPKQWIENSRGTHNAPLPESYFDALARFLVTVDSRGNVGK